MRQTTSPYQRDVLRFLLFADIAFIALHIAGKLLNWTHAPLFLHEDRGYAETLQYVKECWAAVVMLWLALRTRFLAPLVWGVFFAYLFVDDAFSVHEEWGRIFSSQLGFQAAFGLRPNDFGELLTSAVVGAVFAILMIFSYAAGRAWDRGISRDLVVLFSVLAFFGVGVDMVHIMLDGLPIAGLTIVEDGGELLAMSLVAAYASRHLSGGEQPTGAIWDRYVVPGLAALRRFRAGK